MVRVRGLRDTSSRASKYILFCGLCLVDALAKAVYADSFCCSAVGVHHGNSL